MADFAPNFTARHKLHYTTYGDPHDVGARFLATSTQSAVEALAEAFYTSLFGILAEMMTSSWAVISAEYSAAHSDFFVPIPAAGYVPAGEVGVGINPVDEIQMSTWSGRTIGGHSCRFVLFGVFWAPVTDPINTDFTISATERPEVGQVADLLSESGMVGNDNLLAAFWNREVSYKQSDAWRKRRKG